MAKTNDLKALTALTAMVAAALVAVAFVAYSGAASAQGCGIACDSAPTVVSTNPADGATNVDPDTTKVKIIAGCMSSDPVRDYQHELVLEGLEVEDVGRGGSRDAEV